MSDSEFEIAVDNPEADDVRELLARHLAFAREFTPSGHVHALPVEALKDRDVTFYSARRGGALVAIAALKRLDSSGVELKSMHTIEASRGRGAAGALIRNRYSEGAGLPAGQPRDGNNGRLRPRPAAIPTDGL